MKYIKELYKNLIFIFLLFESIYSNVQINFNLYHKTLEIDQKLSILAKSNSFIKEHSIIDIPSLKNKLTYTLLKYYDISNNINDQTKEKIFLLSGEHPRELIAVEAAYSFVEKLVTNQGKYKELLDNYNFRIIVNANPYARINVEKGEYCRRVNMKDVDINRNWDIFWGQKIDLEEENPGRGPFSEVETKFVKSLVNSFKPKIFLTLHSGVYGLYLPYAFARKETNKDKGLMKSILNQIKQKYCPVCQVGAPSLNIGYQSSGTCLDYIYDKLKVPYSFAWEIYSNEVIHPEIAKLTNNRFLKRNNLFIETANRIKPSNFLEVNEKDSLELLNRNKFIAHRFYSSYENQVCLALFNPNEKKSFEFIIHNWTNAMVFLFDSLKKK